MVPHRALLIWPTYSLSLCRAHPSPDHRHICCGWLLSINPVSDINWHQETRHSAGIRDVNANRRTLCYVTTLSTSRLELSDCSALSPIIDMNWHSETIGSRGIRAEVCRVKYQLRQYRKTMQCYNGHNKHGQESTQKRFDCVQKSQSSLIMQQKEGASASYKYAH